MPRVLIADDNSNVQKTVTLALKDAGIEVIAVGNGEAAVRKIPEINPDLVLADIFMPVRNGYEVCEFVKRDPRHMNTPVILLVGAFDPLDEREAQRVQADGVLKKPFVPPDPLVNLVTALLAKAAAAKAILPVPASAPVAQPAVAAPTAKEVKAAPAPAPAFKTEVKAEEQPEPVPLPEEIVDSPAAVVSTDAGDTLAFSSLLETPASGDETDPIVTARRDPSLGEPAFWTSPPAPETAADELTDGHAWEEDAPRHSAAPMLGPDEPEEIQSEEAQASASEEFPDVAVEFDAPQDATETMQETASEESAPLVDTTHWTETPPEVAEAEAPAELVEAELLPRVEQAETEAPSPVLESRESAWRRWAAETTAAPQEAASTETAPEAALKSSEEVQPELEAISETKAAEDEMGETAIPAPLEEAAHEVIGEVAPELAEPVVHEPADADAEPEEAFAFAAAPAPQPPAPAADIPAVIAGSSAAAIAILSAVETAPPASEPFVETPAAAASEPVPAALATVESAPVEEPKVSASTGSTRTAGSATCEKKVELLAVHEDFAAMDELWKSAEPAFPWTRAEPAAAAANDSSEVAGASEAVGTSEAVAASEVVTAGDVVVLSARKEPESETAPVVAAAAVQESKVAEPPAPSPIDSRLQDPEFLEAVVERVIGRMQPRMIEIVTQEILRPIVEAMIRRELEKPQPEQSPK